MHEGWVRTKGSRQRWHAFSEQLSGAIFAKCHLGFHEWEELEWAVTPCDSEKCGHCRKKKQKEGEQDATA